MRSDSSAALARAARRAEHHPFFVAGVLAAYQSANRLDDGALAALPGCQAPDLTRVTRCRRPAPEQARLLAAMDHLAQRFHLRGDHLAMIIRQVDARAAIHPQVQGSDPGAGMGWAARDHEEPTATDAEGQHG